MSIVYTFLSSPFGRILVAWGDRGLVRVGLRGEAEVRTVADWRLDAALDCEATRQLREYFEGARRSFDLPLVRDDTAFRERVWRSLEHIRYGETATYGEVARRVGSPSAARAVGHACGANPLPIVVPCHRVIGNDGRLVGFGGGLAMKRALLAFERAAVPGIQAALPL